MTRARPVYSVRDALGRELWWTTARAQAVRVATELNTVGVGAVLYTRTAHKLYGGARAVYSDSVPLNDGLSAHHLPVAVWKCSEVKPKQASAS